MVGDRAEVLRGSRHHTRARGVIPFAPERVRAPTLQLISWELSSGIVSEGKRASALPPRYAIPLAKASNPRPRPRGS